MYILSTELAQDIVSRTMKIIPYNVNVMDANGSILASGNRARIGELHAGAMLALAKRLTVEIDDDSARHLHGAQPGINLPLSVNGQLCGAVGLSGPPEQVRQFGELVRLTAEMILEQAQLANALQRDSRYREAFVLSLIRNASPQPSEVADLAAWARRLGVKLERPHLVLLLELDQRLDHTTSGNERALAELQQLQLRLLARLPSMLTAAVSAHQLVLLDFYDSAASPDPDWPQRQQQALAALLREENLTPHTLTLGIARTGIAGVAVAYRSALTAAKIGRARDCARRLWSYDELALPVLLSGLDAGWEAEQLRRPMELLAAEEPDKPVLRRTLEVWLKHDAHPAATAAALHIHRNTLDYRLRRISTVTGLDLGKLEHRFLIYVSSLLTA